MVINVLLKLRILIDLNKINCCRKIIVFKILLLKLKNFIKLGIVYVFNLICCFLLKMGM